MHETSSESGPQTEEEPTHNRTRGLTLLNKGILAPSRDKHRVTRECSDHGSGKAKTLKDRTGQTEMTKMRCVIESGSIPWRQGARSTTQGGCYNAMGVKRTPAR